MTHDEEQEEEPFYILRKSKLKPLYYNRLSRSLRHVETSFMSSEKCPPVDFLRNCRSEFISAGYDNSGPVLTVLAPRRNQRPVLGI